MARSSRFNMRPNRSIRRKFDWIGGIDDLSTGDNPLAGNTSVISIAFDTRIIQPIAPWTIVRVRGILAARSDQNIAAEQILGAYGICVVNGEAFDAGVASIPTPWSESFDDRWLYHRYWYAVVEENPTTSDFQYNSFVEEIDGKAMRKVDLGDVVVAVWENASTLGARIFDNFRMGVKLH